MKSFSVLTVSKRLGWEHDAETSLKLQTVQPQKWVVVTEDRYSIACLLPWGNTGVGHIYAPPKTRLSNLNASLNEGLRHIDTDYVIFYQDFIELEENCFEKLLGLADEKTFITTCTPNYDGCFVAGTQILTTDGYKSIENVTTDDKVITPFGRDRVLKCGSTGVKQVRDYGILKATPNHKILTNRGVVPIDDIRYTDSIWVERAGQKTLLGRRYTFLAYLIFAILARRTGLTDYISSGLLTRSLEVKLASSTEKSGSIIMDRFQKVIKSTTKTATMITRLKALSLFLQATTQSNIFGDETKEHEKVLKKLENLLKSGTQQKRGDNGTPNEEKLTGLIEWLIREYATSVPKHMLLEVPEQVGFAVPTVKPQPLENAEVWNLTTENGCYIANGVLVSNSDDGRYTGLDAPRPCRPDEWEANVAIAPMGIIRELGGFDEEYDWGWSWDNVNLAQRAAMLGAKFIIDESNRPKLYVHEMSSHTTLPLNAERHERTMKEIRQGTKPIQLNYLKQNERRPNS